MKKLIRISFLLICLACFQQQLSAQNESAYLDKYGEVMSQFLSHSCMSFTMQVTQYSDFEGSQIEQELAYDVISNAGKWYLKTGDFEVIYSKKDIISIDNNSKIISWQDALGMEPKDIFANAQDFSKLFDYLKLTGSKEKISSGNYILRFKAAAPNRTSIEVEYAEDLGIVWRSTANIDMTNYENLDHYFDGSKIQTEYRNVSMDQCEINQDLDKLLQSGKDALKSIPQYQNYLIK